MWGEAVEQVECGAQVVSKHDKKHGFHKVKGGRRALKIIRGSHRLFINLFIYSISLFVCKNVWICMFMGVRVYI